MPSVPATALLLGSQLIQFGCPAPTTLVMELNGHDAPKPRAGFKIEPFKLEVQQCSHDRCMPIPNGRQLLSATVSVQRNWLTRRAHDMILTPAGVIAALLRGARVHRDAPAMRQRVRALADGWCASSACQVSAGSQS